jgi:hypothetical protein
MEDKQKHDQTGNTGQSSEDKRKQNPQTGQNPDMDRESDRQGQKQYNPGQGTEENR